MKTYYVLIISLLLGASCTPNVALATTLPTSQAVRTSTLQPVIVSAATGLASITPTTTQTLTPIPRHIIIDTPSKKDSPDITLELLQTNNGCDLPCWWGIYPNQTTWSDAEEFLKPFSKIYERKPPSEWSVYDVMSPISDEHSDVREIRMTFAAQQGVLKEIEIGYFNEKTYHLSSLLQRYGVPSKILVSSYSSDAGVPGNQVPLSIDLYYPEKGINALYGTYAAIKGTQIYGCLEKSPILFLWSPSEYIRTIDYILGWDKNQTPYMSIEKATDLDVQGFYDKYKNPESGSCLQTSKSLWPSQ